MKTLLVFGVLFIWKSSAAPTSEDAQAETLRNEFTKNENGNYRFSYETSNKLYRRETGTIVNRGQPDEHILIEGEYSYNDPEGNVVTVFYTAGPKGYNQTIWIAPDSDSDLIDIRLNAHLVATLIG